MNDREPIDPALDAMLRDHSTERPPAHVDAAILAAAHRAVASAPRARTQRHWRLWVPLATAATVTAVVLGLRPDEAPAPEVGPAITVPLADAPRQSAAKAEQSNTAAPAAKLQSPTAASAHEEARNATSAQRTRDAGVTSAQASQDARVAQAIERIRSLRRDGREAEAIAALAQLRATVANADTQLPPDLRAWASTVRP